MDLTTIMNDGLAVLGTGPQGSLAIGALFSHGGPIATQLGRAGMRYAAAGGRLVKGVFVWYTPDGGVASFPFPMNPESIEESLQPNYAESMIPGQNHPMYQFVNGGPRTLSFSLHFLYEERRRESVMEHINTIRSLCRRPYNPKAEGGYEGGPPPVYFYFGDFIRGDRFLVQNAQITCMDLFDPQLLLPLRAEVKLTLVEAVDTARNPQRPEIPAGEGRFGRIANLVRSVF